MLSAFWSSGLRVSVYIVCVPVYYCINLDVISFFGALVCASVFMLCVWLFILAWCYQLSGALVCTSVFILFVWLFIFDVISFSGALVCASVFILFVWLLIFDVISFLELWSARQCSYCLCDCLFLMLSAFWSSGLRVSVHIVFVWLFIFDVISFLNLWSARECSYCLYSCLFLMLSAF